MRPSSRFLLSITSVAAGSVASLACCHALAKPSLTAMVPMHDGVKLATDVYLPLGAGKHPVVLVRTPYDKGASSSESTAKSLKPYGIVTVVQDMRGRFHSEGKDCVFRCDAKDGADTLAWIDKQAWSNDKVLMWGGSALGIVQYLVAPENPPNLKGLWAMIATPQVWDHAFVWNGVLRKSLTEGWLKAQGSEFFLDNIAAHPFDDGYWDSIQTAGRFAQVHVPAVHYGGWYDIFNQGNVDAFVGYQHHGGAGAKGKQKLVMGPWTHQTLLKQKQGELTYPSNATDIPFGHMKMLLAWVRTYLGLVQGTAEVDKIPAVQYYVMGDVTDSSAPGNKWRTAADWPIPAAPIRLYLQEDGALAEACPGQNSGSSTYVYDPAKPSPTKGGGNLIIPAGPMDQSSTEKRADTIAFETPTLTKPMEVTGRVRAHLWVDTDAKDTDLIVRLTDVYPDGRSMLVLDGAQRLSFIQGKKAQHFVTPGEAVEAVVDLWSTSIIINAGHKLRVSVTGANDPRFLPNPNDGTTYRDPKASPVKATVHLHHEAGYSSYVELPDPSRQASEVVVCSGPDLDGGVTDGNVPVHDAGQEDASDSSADASLPEDGGGHADATIGVDAQASPEEANGDSGCSCRMAGRGGTGGSSWPIAWLAVSALGLWRGRRRHHESV